MKKVLLLVFLKIIVPSVVGIVIMYGMYKLDHPTAIWFVNLLFG